MQDRIVQSISGGVADIVIGVTIVICLTRAIIFIVKSLRQWASQKSKIDLYNRMIDKYGDAPEFIAYLQSGTGLQTIEESATAAEAGSAASPMGKILFSAQIGVIAALVGAGLLILGNIFGESLGGDLYIVLTVTGTVGLTVGIGFLISAAISYKLCKTWGLLTTTPIKEKAQTN